MQRLWIIVPLLALAGSANAEQPTAAKELAAKGNTLAAQGDFHGALTMFKRALALDGSVRQQCNVGGAYYKLERWPEANLYLKRCIDALDREEDPEFFRAEQAVFAITEDALKSGEFASVHFEVSPNNATIQVSALPGDINIQPMQTVWLPTGKHQVSISAPGFSTSQTPIDAVKGKLLQVEVALEKPVQLDLKPVAKPPSKTLAFASFGVGIASLATSAAFYYYGYDAKKNGDALAPDDPARNDFRDQVRTRRLVSYSLGGVGIVAGLVGVYLLATAKSDDKSKLSLQVSEHQTQFVGLWRF